MDLKKMADLDDEWLNFEEDDDIVDEEISAESETSQNNDIVPEPSDIYISTKTEIAFLNITKINLNSTFWNIPLIDYMIVNKMVL